MKKLVNYRPKVSEIPTCICGKAPSLLECATQGKYKAGLPWHSISTVHVYNVIPSQLFLFNYSAGDTFLPFGSYRSLMQ
jgi:hypothetical protein